MTVYYRPGKRVMFFRFIACVCKHKEKDALLNCGTNLLVLQCAFETRKTYTLIIARENNFLLLKTSLCVGKKKTQKTYELDCEFAKPKFVVSDQQPLSQ